MMAMQTWDPARYARNARFVADLAMPVVELLDPKPGERILDLGCGDGHLTAKLSALGCEVLGVDSSAAQVESALALGLKAQVLAAEKLPFDSRFDAVFSNATLHWVKDADAAIAGVWRALKPGGRFVGEFGGDGCVAKIRNGLRMALERHGISYETWNPWYFPTAEEYGSRLSRQGFTVASIAIIPRPTALPGALQGWLETFAESFTAALPEKERGNFLAEVEENLRPELCDSEGKWTADYTRLRFRAVKPELGP